MSEQEEPEGHGDGAKEGCGDDDAGGQDAFMTHVFSHNMAADGGWRAEHDKQRD